MRLNDHDYEAIVLFESPQAREIHIYSVYLAAMQASPEAWAGDREEAQIPDLSTISRFPKYNV